MSQKDNKTPCCLVLGGKGFIGSHLVDALLLQGYKVRIFDRPSTVFLEGACEQHDNLEIVEGDFTSESEIAAAVVDCEICFHLVSTTLPKSSNLDPVFDIETNLLGTVRLLNQVVKAKVKKVVFLSSGGTVYGPPLEVPIDETHQTNPICSYGITKLAIEKYLDLFFQLHGINYTVLRLANPFGERQRIQSSQGAIAVFLGKALRNEKIEIWGDGSVVRDFLHVSDVVTAMIASIDYQGSDRVFNIGSGAGISLNEVVEGISQVLGRTIDKVYTEGRAFDVPVSVLAIERAKAALNWQPQMNFVEGLKRMADWLKNDCKGQVSQD